MCDIADEATVAADGGEQTECPPDRTREATFETIEDRAREIERRELERAMRALEECSDIDETEAEAVRKLASGLVDGLLEPVAATLDQPAQEHEIQTAVELFGE